EIEAASQDRRVRERIAGELRHEVAGRDPCPLPAGSDGQLIDVLPETDLVVRYESRNGNLDPIAHDTDRQTRHDLRASVGSGWGSRSVAAICLAREGSRSVELRPVGTDAGWLYCGRYRGGRGFHWSRTRRDGIRGHIWGRGLAGGRVGRIRASGRLWRNSPHRIHRLGGIAWNLREPIVR